MATGADLTYPCTPHPSHTHAIAPHSPSTRSLLAAAPLPTKMATGAAGAFLGDLVAQSLPHALPHLSSHLHQASDKAGHATETAPSEPFVYNPARAGRLMMYSAVISTPLLHYWYHFLDLVGEACVVISLTHLLC